VTLLRLEHGTVVPDIPAHVGGGFPRSTAPFLFQGAKVLGIRARHNASAGFHGRRPPAATIFRLPDARQALYYRR